MHQVLTNEKYIGNNVYNKVSFKLKQRRVVNPREMWIRAEGAYARSKTAPVQVLLLRGPILVEPPPRHRPRRG